MSECVRLMESMIASSAIVNDNYLTEKDDQGTVFMKLRIQRRAVQDILLWRYDPNIHDWFPFFSNGVSGLKSICDYFLFVERNDRQYLCLLELKNSSYSAKRQLEASEAFADYLITSARRVRIIIGDPLIVKVRIVGGKPGTRYRQPEYEHDSGYISYRLPVIFDIMSVLDVFDSYRNGR